MVIMSSDRQITRHLQCSVLYRFEVVVFKYHYIMMGHERICQLFWSAELSACMVCSNKSCNAKPRFVTCSFSIHVNSSFSLLDENEKKKITGLILKHFHFILGTFKQCVLGHRKLRLCKQNNLRKVFFFAKLYEYKATPLNKLHNLNRLPLKAHI